MYPLPSTARIELLAGRELQVNESTGLFATRGMIFQGVAVMENGKPKLDVISVDSTVALTLSQKGVDVRGFVAAAPSMKALDGKWEKAAVPTLECVRKVWAKICVDKVGYPVIRKKDAEKRSLLGLFAGLAGIGLEAEVGALINSLHERGYPKIEYSSISKDDTLNGTVVLEDFAGYPEAPPLIVTPDTILFKVLMFGLWASKARRGAARWHEYLKRRADSFARAAQSVDEATRCMRAMEVESMDHYEDLVGAFPGLDREVLRILVEGAQRAEEHPMLGNAVGWKYVTVMAHGFGMTNYILICDFVKSAETDLTGLHLHGPVFKEIKEFVVHHKLLRECTEEKVEFAYIYTGDIATRATKWPKLLLAAQTYKMKVSPEYQAYLHPDVAKVARMFMRLLTKQRDVTADGELTLDAAAIRDVFGYAPSVDVTLADLTASEEESARRDAERLLDTIQARNNSAAK